MDAQSQFVHFSRQSRIKALAEPLGEGHLITNVGRWILPDAHLHALQPVVDVGPLGVIGEGAQRFLQVLVEVVGDGGKLATLVHIRFKL